MLLFQVRGRNILQTQNVLRRGVRSPPPFAPRPLPPPPAHPHSHPHPLPPSPPSLPSHPPLPLSLPAPTPNDPTPHPTLPPPHTPHLLTPLSPIPSPTLFTTSAPFPPLSAHSHTIYKLFLNVLHPSPITTFFFHSYFTPIYLGRFTSCGLGGWVFWPGGSRGGSDGVISVRHGEQDQTLPEAKASQPNHTEPNQTKTNRTQSR